MISLEKVEGGIFGRTGLRKIIRDGTTDFDVPVGQGIVLARAADL